MKHWLWFVLILVGFIYLNNTNLIQITNSQEKLILNDSIPKGIEKLLKVYPGKFIGARQNTIIWSDSTEMEYDDGVKNKSFHDLLTKPDIEDQINAMKYNLEDSIKIPDYNQDPGRIRYQPFFTKMYGDSKEKVLDSLVEIIWLPKTLNKKILISMINGVDKKLEQISKELDNKPHLMKFLESPGGTFNWRNISGTNRLSTHSFGITIDINVKESNYWQWDYKNWKELKQVDTLKYRNKIPIEIVKIFEKHGFIWGGRWYHYDTMHFEYRPEML